MSGIPSALQGAQVGGHDDLATQLTELADDATRAATFADGEYIPQMSREHELRTAFSESGRAAARLEALRRQIAKLDGADDGMRLANAAIDNLQGGRRAIQEGVSVAEDVLRSGTIVADAIATGTAGGMFREAAAGMRGIADIALLEATGVDDLFAAITRGGA